MDEAWSELDLSRLGALADELGQTPAQVAGTLHDELEHAFARLDTALRGGEREAAAEAVHAARNSALMVGARPLLAGLRALDTALGAGDLAGARNARERLAGPWSVVEAALRTRR